MTILKKHVFPTQAAVRKTCFLQLNIVELHGLARSAFLFQNFRNRFFGKAAVGIQVRELTRSIDRH